MWLLEIHSYVFFAIFFLMFKADLGLTLSSATDKATGHCPHILFAFCYSCLDFLLFERLTEMEQAIYHNIKHLNKTIKGCCVLY